MFHQDENFLPTLVMNSPYQDTCYYSPENELYSSLMYTCWMHMKPNFTLDETDLDYIKDSGVLYARKFAKPIFIRFDKAS
jgi:hypothetical protein